MWLLITLALGLIYFYIGVACVGRRAFDIACWEALNPSSDLTVFWMYVITWPWWVFKR